MGPKEEEDDVKAHLLPDSTKHNLTVPDGDNIDDILRKAGGFGRYQILVQALSFLIMVTVSHQALDMYFLAEDPAWRCTEPYRRQLNNNLLVEEHNTSQRFCKQHPGIIQSDSDLFDKRCELPPNNWEFTVKNPATYSLVTEYKLYCSKSGTLSLAHSAFFIGSSVASLFLGFFADHYGRKYTFCVLVVIMFASAISTSFITTTWQFILVRTLLGASGSGCMSTMYVLAVEFVLPEHRAFTSNLIQISYAVAIFNLTLVAYLCREWRHTALYTALPTSVSFLNKHPIDVHFDPSSESRQRNTYSILDCFKYKKTAVIVIVVTLTQYFGGVVYYTMYLEFNRIGGSAYVVLALAAAADFPALLLASYFPDKYGRKKSFFASYFLVVLCVLPIVFTPEEYGQVVLVRVASAVAVKVFFSCAADILILWTLEIFPTAVRTQGLVITQMGTRIGSGTAPFIVQFLRSLNYVAPFLAIIVLSVCGMLLSFFLPETLGKPTREDFEDFFSDNLIVERRGNANADNSRDELSD